MAWSYAPRQVVKWREAPFDTDSSKGPNFLLVLVAICAFVFVFTVVSDILNTVPPSDKSELMIKLNNGNMDAEGGNSGQDGGQARGERGDSTEKQVFGKLRWRSNTANDGKARKPMTLYQRDQKIRELEKKLKKREYS